MGLAQSVKHMAKPLRTMQPYLCDDALPVLLASSQAPGDSAGLTTSSQGSQHFSLTAFCRVEILSDDAVLLPVVDSTDAGSVLSTDTGLGKSPLSS